MPRTLSPVTLAGLLALPAAAQSVPCEKFTLDNGMTVILHVDHKIPAVAVNTWFRVGCKDEPPGRSGFAHLFEHLMFMGTERVTGNQFDVVMEGGGGFNNASTTEDRTNYFSQGPAAILPTLLWLDANRFEDLARSMDQQKLDRQREVVRNEIREQVENQPYGRLERAKFNLMFPLGHPYHDSTYGTHADLEAATLDDVRDFFASFYVPNNASLVVVGDFEAERVKPLIRDLFGSLPRAPQPPRRVVAPVNLEGVVRATLLDRVQMPLCEMVWHAPPDASEGTAELTLLAQVLAAGKDSRLYRRLVDGEGLAVDVEASLDGLALGSLFSIEVFANPGTDLARVEAIVDEELARVRMEPVGVEELERRKTTRELSQLAALQDFGRVADQLNRYQYLWGEPDSFARDLARYRAVTPESLREVARNVLDPKRRAILHVLPQDAPREPSARDTRPADFPLGSFRAQAPDEFRLGNGIRVLHWERKDLPLCAVRLQIAPGAPLIDATRCGVIALLGDMLTEGAGERDGARFAADLEALGARFGAWIDHESANASLFVLRRNLEPALALAADAVRRPRLLDADFERARRVRLGMLQAEDEQPETIASRVALRVLFGDDDPYAWPASGTVASVTAATAEQVRDTFRSVFTPTDATLLIAGDIDRSDAQRVLEKAFGDWRAPDGVSTAHLVPTTPPKQALRVVIVDRPDAAQTVIQWYAPAPVYGDPSRIRLQALSTLLGGSFTSRLNQNLREQHGYCYGASTAFSLGPWRGWFTASASVQTAVTGPALKEMLAEFARLRAASGGDVSEEEAQKVQRTLLAQVVDSFARLDGVIASAAELALNGLPLDQIDRDVAAIEHTTAADIDVHAGDDLALDHAVLVLVGDKKTILAQIGDLGLPAARDCDARGRFVGR